MAYAKDTHTISLDAPVAEGIVKALCESKPWDTDMSQETFDIKINEQEVDSIQVKPTFVSDGPISFSEWLGIAAAKLSGGLVTALAATQINLARLSSDPQLTVPVDEHAILRVISEQRSSVVSVSRGLIAPRSQIQASCLLAPSGGYLAWMEMLQEKHDVASE